MLSQAEIDALLGAVTSDEPPRAAGVPAPVAVAEPAYRAVKTYDFRRPDKFSKEQLRTLQAIHENVARIVGARLSARLRSVVSLTLADTAQMVYDQFVESLNLPTELIVVAAGGLGGPFLVDFDLGLAYACVDRLLGGPGRIPRERREPTTIEAALIDRVIGDMVPAIAEGWSHLCALDPKVSESALGPALLRVAAPSHVVAALTFEVRMAGQGAPISVCYPHDSLAPILPRLSATAWYAETGGGKSAPSDRHEIAEVLGQVDIPVSAILGGIDLSVEQLADLAPGDVIRFEERADAPIVLSVLDQVRAGAIPGRVGDRLAVQLVSPLALVEA